MLDIGWWELLVVGMVALVVVGPKELPTLLRTIGRYVGMAKRQADEFRSQFDDALRESEFNELRNEMNEIKSDVTSSMDEAQQSLNKELSETDYDWDQEEKIKPAPEFADDEPTTSFTTPDGEVITKQDAESGNSNETPQLAQGNGAAPEASENASTTADLDEDDPGQVEADDSDQYDPRKATSDDVPANDPTARPRDAETVR